MRVPPAASAVLLLAAGLAAAADTFDYRRHFELSPKGHGTWSGKFVPGTGEGELVGLALVADWWEGPGDPRVGDEAKSAQPGTAYEVRRGEGAWTALPPADRDLRLLLRTEAPADAKALLGGSPGGEWTVRQVAGGAFPKTVRIEFTCRGDALLVKDLRVKSLMLPGLDPKPVIGREYIPDRTENPTLRPGAAIRAEVVVENCGARRTKEVDLDLLAVPAGKRQGKRLGFAQVPVLKSGETAALTISGTLPEDVAAEGGAWEILAFVNPRAAEPEVELWNNAVGRAFVLEIPKKEGALPTDLRDR
jgi:hypothetical protein